MLSRQMQGVKITMVCNNARFFSHPQWNKKSRVHFKPTYFDNINYNNRQRNDNKQKRFKYLTQDPLFMDYNTIHMSGGIKPYID